MRILFLAGDGMAVGRYHWWAGLLPSARHAELAATLHALGHQAVLVAETAIDRPDELAALARRQRPDAVVAETDTLPAPMRQALTTLGLVTVWTSRTPAGPVAAGGEPDPGDGAVPGDGTYHVHEADVPAFLGALGLSGQAPVAPSPRAAVVPPALRPRVGIELARLDPDGVARVNELGRVARAVEDAAPFLRAGGHPSAQLVGLELLAPAAARRALAGVAELLPTPVALRARVRLAQLSVPGSHPGAPGGERHALGELLGSLLTTVELEVGSATSPDVGRLVSVLGRHGAEVLVDATFDEDLERLEALAQDVAAAGGELCFTWADGAGPLTVSEGEQLLAAAGSTTLFRQAGLGPRRSLMTLLTGRSERHPAATGAGAVLLTPGAEEHDCAAVGLRTDVFGQAPPRRPVGRFWPLDVEVDGGVARAGTGGELVVDGACLETSPYAEARHATPFEPLLLELTGRSDVEAFLADADVARREGRFPRALVSPFGILADSCAWGEPGACAGEHLGRVVVEASGEVRLAPGGPVVGHATQSHSELVRSVRQHLAELRARRGCATCPVVSTCSKDTCLSGLLGDDAYCAARVARPWLTAYLDAVDAIRTLRRDPAEELPQISGFGGLLHADLECRHPLDRPAVVLSRWKGSFYGFVPDTGRAFTMTAHTCLVAEALLTRGPESPVEAVARHLAIGLDRATEAAGMVATLLTERGAELGPRTGRGDHPAGAAQDPSVAHCRAQEVHS